MAESYSSFPANLQVQEELSVMKARCSKCCLEKDVSEFYERKGRPRGVRSRCKACETTNVIRVAPSYTGFKECAQCKCTAPLRKFVVDTRRKEGRGSWCKKCDYKKRLDRLHATPELRIVENLRRRTRAVLEGINKSDNTLSLIGCSPIQLKRYLESLFTDKMDWNNYGKWHIDHIIPCSFYDLTSIAEQHRCFHYTNLQPLWAKDNLQKGNKVCQKQL